ncbi:MAG: putative PEP-binding protein [Microcella pacifica]
MPRRSSTAHSCSWTVRTGEVLVDPDATAQATATGVLTTPPFVGPGATSDGHRVVLGSNVGAPRDVARAVERGAEGVGLFRTEFCFLDREAEPSIPQQVSEYRQVFAAFPGQRVVVRTLDAGSDKPLPFLTADDEPNPALGVRGVRTARRNPEVLDRQLAAIAEAARHEAAEIWVMAPMIATLSETHDFAARARSAGIGSVGVMIENARGGPHRARAHGRRRLREHWHERPGAVHARRRPHARRSR